MSWRATAHVKPLRTCPNGEPLTRSEKLLLMVLADYYNDDQHAAWPSVRRLAAQTLLCERQTRNLLRSLEAKGLIICTRRTGADGVPDTNVYHLPGLETAEGVGQSLPDIGQSVQEDGASIPAPYGATMLAAKRLPEPQGEPKEEEKQAVSAPQAASRAESAPVEIPADVTAMLATLCRHTALEPLPELAVLLATRYAHLDLEEEAVRIVSWLRQRHQECSEIFVLDWLRRDRSTAPIPMPQAVQHDIPPRSDAAPALPPLQADQILSAEEEPAESGGAALWRAVVPALRGRLKRSDWETWIDGAEVVGLDGDELLVALPTERAAEWIRRKWGELANETAAWATGRSLRIRWVAARDQVA